MDQSINHLSTFQGPLYKTTVPAPIKDAASIQKCFLTYTLWCILHKVFHSFIVKIDKFWQKCTVGFDWKNNFWIEAASFIGAGTVVGLIHTVRSNVSNLRSNSKWDFCTTFSPVADLCISTKTGLTLLFCYTRPSAIYATWENSQSAKIKGEDKKISAKYQNIFVQKLAKV